MSYVGTAGAIVYSDPHEDMISRSKSGIVSCLEHKPASIGSVLIGGELAVSIRGVVKLGEDVRVKVPSGETKITLPAPLVVGESPVITA